MSKQTRTLLVVFLGAAIGAAVMVGLTKRRSYPQKVRIIEGPPP